MSDIDGIVSKGVSKFKSANRKVDRAIKDADDRIEKKIEGQRKFRQKVLKLQSAANKRLKRLEEKGMTGSTAYQMHQKFNGGGYFSMKGKTQAELQEHLRKLDQFMSAETSTIKGINQVLRRTASDMNIKYSTMKELQKAAPVFFDIVSKVQQILKHQSDIAAQIGYRQIQTTVAKHVDSMNIELAKAEGDIDKIAEAVSAALTDYDKGVKLDFSHLGGDTGEWKLPKD